jgi:hypothetical protein
LAKETVVSTNLVIDTATGTSEVVEYTDDEKATLAAIHEATLPKRRLKAWERRMASFTMTRVEEEVISNLTADQKAALPEYTRDKHAQKLVARSERPDG